MLKIQFCFASLCPGNWRKCFLSVAEKQGARFSERGCVLGYGSYWEVCWFGGCSSFLLVRGLTHSLRLAWSGEPPAPGSGLLWPACARSPSKWRCHVKQKIIENSKTQVKSVASRTGGDIVSQPLLWTICSVKHFCPEIPCQGCVGLCCINDWTKETQQTPSVTWGGINLTTKDPTFNNEFGEIQW